MTKYIISRLLHIIPVLFIVSIVVFMMLHLIPGDPAVNILGLGASKEAIKATRTQLGLDKPLFTQYFIFLKNALSGDFGISIPYFQDPVGVPVLTIIMGALMFFQQRMSPPPGDPAQAKMMMFLPLIFTVIFVNFPAGLVLYWMVNNAMSIGQQYYIQKKFA